MRQGMLSERYETFGREKLLDLAEALETRELTAKFNMGTLWFKENECGTSACAAGHGILLGVLPGLELKREEGDYYSSLAFGETEGGDDVLSEYFGLDWREINILFFSDEKTKQAEAALIRRFVEKKDGK